MGYGVWIRRMEIWGSRGWLRCAQEQCGKRCELGWSCVDEHGEGKCALPRRVALRSTTLPYAFGEQGIRQPRTQGLEIVRRSSILYPIPNAHKETQIAPWLGQHPTLAIQHTTHTRHCPPPSPHTHA